MFLEYSKLFPITVFEPIVLIVWNAYPPDLNTADFSSSFKSQFSHHLCSYPLTLLISFITPVTPSILSVQFSHSVVSDSLRPHGLQHASLPCPSPTPRAYSNLCPLSQWCHPTISSSIVHFSYCLQSFPVSPSFPMSWLFAPNGRCLSTTAEKRIFFQKALT